MPVTSHPVDQPAAPDGRADVELRVPADSAYASVLRTTTAGLAARLDFTIDDIEDLRIAVAEASALVLEQADTGSDLVAAFRLAPGAITITLAVTAAGNPVPDLDSFAWQVLTTLADDADIESSGGTFAVTMTMTSTAAQPGS
ncbi:anti-sigma factor [Nocardioides litoris]|uniref:anti-sigma factor n=1 Tax=Nocardioides litoris TaxID=1926648 RepID=UPI001122618C|nr:anti-sigma factor [Nocardioides litoris]